MKKLLLVPLLGLLFVACDSKKGTFLETLNIKEDVPTAVKKFVKVVEEQGLTHFETINHSKNAKDAGLRLKPESVVVFGNVQMGSKLMECNPSMGLDLPLKMLFSTSYEGQTSLTYTNPEYWTLKHNIKNKNCLAIINKATIAMQNLADAMKNK
jgi:uncharacterized protein (DUF302 family)